MINRLTEWEWRKRVARFAGLDRDTVERKQVMPVPEPIRERQTHNAVAELNDGD